jgi:hypothetical protein
MTKRTVTCEITDLELMRMLPPVPLPVQIRQKLNSHGFKQAVCCGKRKPYPNRHNRNAV